MPIKKLIGKIESNPRKLFVIDGSGALLSSFLLGVILVKYERIFGIPAATLYFLAAIPVLFAIYDLYCYQKWPVRSAKCLKGIAYMNMLYCCISVGFAFYHHKEITHFGWAYILVEVLIVMMLARFELAVARKMAFMKMT